MTAPWMARPHRRVGRQSWWEVLDENGGTAALVPPPTVANMNPGEREAIVETRAKLIAESVNYYREHSSGA